MKCPTCGNEISQDEVFCGQCGAPSTLSIKPTEMVQTPPTYNRLMNSGYNTQLSPTPFTAGTQPPSQPAGAFPPNPNQPAIRPVGPQQQSGFYQDATEAMSVMPNSGPNYPAGYPGTPMQGGYPATGQYGQPMQPFQTGNYTGTNYPPTQPYQAGQVYGTRPGPTPPPRQRNSVVLVIAIICFAFAIIAASAFGILYLVNKNHANTGATPTTGVTATTVPSPSPSPTPSPSPSPTETPSPSPTPSPTVTPADAGFSLCGAACATNGFAVEFPNGWLQSAPDAATIEFNNPTVPDIYAIFRTPPGTTSANASTLVSTDLTNNYAMKPGYTAPTSTSNATIGGANWSYAIATYQLNGAPEQVEVFATVYQNKVYIIELQAAQAQFEMVNTNDFQFMLNRFTFQQGVQ